MPGDQSHHAGAKTRRYHSFVLLSSSGGGRKSSAPPPPPRVEESSEGNVVATQELAGGGARYDLAPWDDQHAIRVLLPYDETSEAERSTDARDVGRRRAAGWLTLLLAPVTGLLPGRVQERLEVELGIRAATLTLASVFVPMAAGTYAMLMTLASGLGPGVQVEGPAIAPSVSGKARRRSRRALNPLEGVAPDSGSVRSRPTRSR